MSKNLSVDTDNKNTTVDSNLENFKVLVRKGIRLSKEETTYFNAVPNDVWANIFRVNFNNNFAYANRVILSRFKEINKIDKVRVDREKKKIHNLEIATDMIIEGLEKKTPIIFITDFDNDGSLSQSVINQYLKIDTVAKETMHVEYAQSVNGNSNRGLNVDHVELLINYYGYAPNSEFIIITADNGINSREEQLKIEKAFPNCKIIITDHHNPDPDMVINERKNKTVIFNPHYKPTPFFKEFNISGASTAGVLLQNVLERRFSQEILDKHAADLEVMDKLCKVSNLLDYVHTDPVDKPEKDYVVSRFLKLQPLLNVTNAITRLITENIEDDTIDAIKKRIPTANVDVIFDEEKNIKIQNYTAKALLSVSEAYAETPVEIREQLQREDFFKAFAEKLADLKNENLENFVNTNFIEQLRPQIFSLSANDDNTAFLDELNDAMQNVFKELRVSERKISEELRKGEVVTRQRSENSTIIYADANVLKSFTRKFLNKVYNDENPGFMLTLDSIKPNRVSGSFRSLYDISDIIPNKKKLETLLNCKIETPGHERAAGFILTAKDPINHPITDKTIAEVNHYINESIGDLKKKDKRNKKDYLLTDFNAIQLIDRINQVVRGNISNFENIKPVLKIDENTVWTDPFTAELHTMKEITENRQYGYVSLNINFSGDTIIVPTELLRRIIKNGYTEYLALDYMDGGVFMGSRVVDEKNAKSIIDLRNQNHKTQAIVKAWEESGLKNSPLIKLNREQIKDNPFFKYSDYGDLNFDLFEQIVIGVIDSNKVDTLCIFDVEAIGFANAKIINLGSMNYQIDPTSGVKMNKAEFARKFFTNSRGETYLLTDLEMEELTTVSHDQIQELTPEQRKFLLTNSSLRIMGQPNTSVSASNPLNNKESAEELFYIPNVLRSQNSQSKVKTLPYKKINNFKIDGDNVLFNRTIVAEMLAYLVNESDFKIPAPMTSLTGIDMNILKKYGKPTKQVDAEFCKYYESKKVLFGAHNIPYDGRIFAANMPLSHQMLIDNHIYDSALFARKELLAYDNVQVTSFSKMFVNGATTSSGSEIFFYNNPYSEFNLTNFILKGENGVYPDRTGNFLLEIENGKFFMVDKIEHKKVKITFNESFLGQKFDEIADAEMTLLITEQVMEEFEKDTGEEYQLSSKEIKKTLALEDIVRADMAVMSSMEHAENPDLPIQTRALLYAFKTGNMPGNSVKYSVEKLSEQYMIRSLLLHGEDFKINHVDVTKSKYEKLRPFAQELIFFQENYHFDTDMHMNIYDFRNMFPHVESIHIESVVYLDENGNNVINTKDLLEDFVNEFLSINKVTQEKFADAWIYKKVLEYYEPNPNSNDDAFRAHNKDMIDLVNFHTAIPKEKIIKVFNDAIAFKQHFGVDHIIQHESHVNGPIDGDVKGDIAFEDKLTLALLAERSYNSYNHSIEGSIKLFNQFSMDASLAFDKSNMLNDLAVDSYSYRQGLGYSREHQTYLIQKIKGFEEQLNTSNQCSLVKFKLDNDILPSKTAVMAVTKPNVTLSREQIEKDSDMFSFIALNEQIIASLGKSSSAPKKKKLKKSKKSGESEQVENEVQDENNLDMTDEERIEEARVLAEVNLKKKFISMLESNRQRAFDYKADLSQRYKFADFTRRDEQINNLLKTGLAFLALPDEDKLMKMKTPSDLDFNSYEIVTKILENYVNNAKRLSLDPDHSLRDNLNLFKSYIEFYQNNADTRFEQALVMTSVDFNIAEGTPYQENSKVEVFERDATDGIISSSFLQNFKVNRLKPINLIFETHSSHRLLNSYVSDQMDVQSVSNVRKPKM